LLFAVKFAKINVYGVQYVSKARKNANARLSKPDFGGAITQKSLATTRSTRRLEVM